MNSYHTGGSIYDNNPVRTRTYVKHFSFKKTMRKYAYDWAWVLVTGLIALGIYFLPPVPDRLFLLEYNGAPLNFDNDFPKRTEIMPVTLAGVIALVVGLIVLTIAQIWVHDCKDFHRGLLGLVTALIASSWFQVICKVLIGGVRPNFLEICKPDMTKAVGQGYYGLYYDRSACTGDVKLINDALESFPSGHSNAAFAGMLYLSLYINAKVKLWGNGYGAVWKLYAVFLPILAAVVMSLCRLLDYTHHWYDILAGAIIGTCFAFSCYRMHYRSIFNPKDNHILLSRKKKYSSSSVQYDIFIQQYHHIEQTRMNISSSLIIICDCLWG
eukprot:TRINITY_DN1269_c0_g1_i1.p1 TRINITY_DN1269_c0_g1~~TRINITY_DN1269_c0_g1_i1.p1  ORF type:complete len:326 (+),score=66.30 TRINITY_DN1269_c0_g1_i1:148-1125(+)